jgi:ATP-dependent DNA helicase DinG
MCPDAARIGIQPAGAVETRLPDAARTVVRLLRSPEGMAGAADVDLLTCFPAQRLPPPRKTVPDPAEYEPLDAGTVQEVFEAAGELAVSLPGFEARPEQAAMARAVAEAFNESRHLMVEGGTGIGKSLAYLVPAVLWALKNGTPVIISTNTKNLQAQLFEKDLPALRSALQVEFRSALIKGRMNYLCLRKLLMLIRHADFELVGDEPERMADIVAWSVQTRSGDMTELADRVGRLGGLAGRLTSTGEECLGRGCGLGSRCFLRQARAASLSADIVVANHALVFAEMNLLSTALPPYAHIIFDEAHNLEASATQHFSTEVSAPRIRLLLGRIWRRHTRSRKRNHGSGVLAVVAGQIESGALAGTREARQEALDTVRSVRRALRTTGPAINAYFEALAAYLPEENRESTFRFPASFLADPGQCLLAEATGALTLALGRVADAIDGLLAVLQNLDEAELPLHAGVAGDLQAQARALRELCLDIDFVMRADDPGYVFWIERPLSRTADLRAWAAPVRIGERLCSEVYAQKASIIFSSATLSARGSFDFMKNRLGLDRVEQDRLREFNAGSPFDYARQCRVLVPMFLDDPGAQDANYAEALGSLLAQVFQATRGRGLVLFTSYGMLRQTAAVLRQAVGAGTMDVLVQGESGSRETITETFKTDLESVLMGTHSFWEGVDAMGETLSCLVLARLPFAVFTEPVTQARCEQIEAAGGNAFIEYSLPGAVIRFRQGFGRLIRHRTDRGIVIVADKRIYSRRYGAWFRNSVPAPVLPVSDQNQLLQAVRTFMAEDPA